MEIGALDVKRDWGYSPDYVEGMWRMLQVDDPKDYVLATGENHSVREWIESCFGVVGINIYWEGNNENEVGRCIQDGEILIKVNPKFYRPAEIQTVVGDSSLAARELGWQSKVKFQELVELMMSAELDEVAEITD